jgi:sugar diacid utilization regulator
MREIDDSEGGYRAIPAEELAAAADGMARAALAALIDQRRPTEAELAQAAFLGDRRARQGLSLETVLRGVRVAAREGLEAIRDLAVTADLDAASVISLATALLDWTDGISVALAEAHRKVELAAARRDQQQRASFVYGLVRGTLGPARLTEGIASFGLHPDAEMVVVRARPDAEHTAEAIEQLLVPSWSAGLTAVVEDDVVAILPDPPSAELPIAAGLGPAAPLPAIPRSFRLAGRALDTALAFGLTGAHRLDDLRLRSAVLAETDVGDLLAARHIAPLRALGDFGDELLHSLRVYMRADQSIDAAAKQLYVHPNTLRHRLTRVEETTGASLRDLDDLTEIWWALTREELG